MVVQYLYGVFESSYSEVEWFVSIKVNEAKNVAVDLHNENTARIRNKENYERKYY